MWIEDGGKKQHQQQAIYNKGEGIVEAVVEHENDETEGDGCSNPHNLHARTGTQTEDVSIAIGIAGTTDTDPAERQQRQVKQYRPPVKRTQHTRTLPISRLTHKLSSCAESQ